MNMPLELHPGAMLLNPMAFNVAHALPELILAVGALFLLLFGAIRGKESDGPVTEIAIGVLGLAIVVILLNAHAKAIVFDGAFIDDGFGRFMKVLTLVGSIVTLLMGQSFLARERIDKFEYPILVIFYGFHPSPILNASGPSVATLVKTDQEATLARGRTAALPSLRAAGEATQGVSRTAGPDVAHAALGSLRAVRNDELRPTLAAALNR